MRFDGDVDVTPCLAHVNHAVVRFPTYEIPDLNCAVLLSPATRSPAFAPGATFDPE